MLAGIVISCDLKRRQGTVYLVEQNGLFPEDHALLADGHQLGIFDLSGAEFESVLIDWCDRLVAGI